VNDLKVEFFAIDLKMIPFIIRIIIEKKNVLWKLRFQILKYFQKHHFIIIFNIII